MGPDLATLNDKSPEALLIAILDPNRAFESRYAGFTVATDDGRILSGLISGETASAVTLRLQEGRDAVLLRSQIDEMAGSGQSLMPEGVEKDLTPQATGRPDRLPGGGGIDPELQVMRGAFRAWTRDFLLIPRSSHGSVCESRVSKPVWYQFALEMSGPGTEHPIPEASSPEISNNELAARWRHPPGSERLSAPHPRRRADHRRDSPWRLVRTSHRRGAGGLDRAESRGPAPRRRGPREGQPGPAALHEGDFAVGPGSPTDVFRLLARLLDAATRWAALEGRPDEAAARCLDLVRLGHAVGRGGLLLHRFTGEAIEGLGLAGLGRIAEALDAGTCRAAAAPWRSSTRAVSRSPRRSTATAGGTSQSTVTRTGRPITTRPPTGNCERPQPAR